MEVIEMTTTFETAIPATQPQINYILSLAAGREWRTNVEDHLWKVILADFIERHEMDATAFVPKTYAGTLIDALKACPFTAQTTTAAGTTDSEFSQLIKLLPTLPKSKYAIKREGTDIIDFYAVVTWQGKTYLNQLFGAPGAFKRTKLPISIALKIAKKIAENPLAAAGLFCDKHTVCAVCSAPLTDMTSLANGIGPVCIKRFQ